MGKSSRERSYIFAASYKPQAIRRILKNKKTRGLKSTLDESTLALALVIPDYRPDMLDLMQRRGHNLGI